MDRVNVISAATPAQIEACRRHIEHDRAQLRMELELAAGFLAGSGFPGCTAAVLIALDRLCPAHGLVIEGWRASDTEVAPCR